MRLKLISCEVFYREMCWLIARSPHTVDVEFLRKGIHDLGGRKMSELMQEQLDAVDETPYDAVLLGYGLCGNGLAGLRARTVPLVLPRAHDCITLFLGSRARYAEHFTEHPDTYYLTSGWLERGEGNMEQHVFMRPGSQLASFSDLVDRYGEETAQYMAEELGLYRPPEQYTFIEMGIEGDDRFEQQAKERARERECGFEKLRGSMALLEKLVNGEWNEKDFLVCPPGNRIESDPADAGIVKAVEE